MGTPPRIEQHGDQPALQVTQGGEADVSRGQGGVVHGRHFVGLPAGSRGKYSSPCLPMTVEEGR